MKQQVIILSVNFNANALITIFFIAVLTIQYLDSILKPSYALANTNAKKSVDEGKYQQYIAEKQISTTKRTDDFEDDKVKQKFNLIK